MEQSGLNGMSAKGSVDVAYFGVFHVWGVYCILCFCDGNPFRRKAEVLMLKQWSTGTSA